MPGAWEGNHRSVITLAMRPRLEWFIHLQAHSLRKGCDHPTNTTLEVWHTFSIPFVSTLQRPICFKRIRFGFGI